MFTIQVLNEADGEPIEGIEVQVSFDGWTRCGFTDKEYTDEDGEAEFDNAVGTGTVYIDGEDVGEYELRGYNTIYYDYY